MKRSRTIAITIYLLTFISMAAFAFELRAQNEITTIVVITKTAEKGLHTHHPRLSRSRRDTPSVGRLRSNSPLNANGSDGSGERSFSWPCPNGEVAPNPAVREDPDRTTGVYP